MADENTQPTQPQVTQPTEPVQATDTKNFVPAWQIQADKLQKVADELTAKGEYAKVGYKSDNSISCEPILLTTKQDKDEYPIAVTRPDGFVAPNYEWFGDHQGWVETASLAQGKRLGSLEESLDSMKKNLETQNTQMKNLVQTVSDTKETNDQENQKVMQMIKTIQQGQVQTTNILGQMLPAVQELTKFAQNIQQKEASKIQTQPQDQGKED